MRAPFDWFSDAVRASAAVSERSTAFVQDYEFVPAVSVDAERLLAFDAIVQPERQARDRILASWWRHATPDCAVAAIHTPSGAMVGICAGRPSTWVFPSGSTPAVAICSWFVDPAHFGKGIGKRMVKQLSAPGRFLYTFVISEAAIANFERLGWVGPYVAPMLACPLPGLLAISSRRDAGIELRDYLVNGRDIPAPLGAALDRIDRNRASESCVHMRRNAQELCWRLSLSSERQYRFTVASRANEPVGYVAVRRATPGTNRLMDLLRAAIVTDLVAVDNEAAVLRSLASSGVASAGHLHAMTALVTTTVPAQQKALAAAGFLSSRVPLVGSLLSSRSPRFMWVAEGPAAQLAVDGIALTFADSDADFNL
jgi:ribosomal protein S18 acetylase RimI-like enzyme